MMNQILLETLKNLPDRAGRSDALFEQLAFASYVALVTPGTEASIDQMQFVATESSGVVIIPLFTSMAVCKSIRLQTDDLPITLPGNQLWPRLLPYLKEKNVRAAVDPATPYGIVLTFDEISRMIARYGLK
jgi:hypothetical protein